MKCLETRTTRKRKRFMILTTKYKRRFERKIYNDEDVAFREVLFGHSGKGRKRFSGGEGRHTLSPHICYTPICGSPNKIVGNFGTLFRSFRFTFCRVPINDKRSSIFFFFFFFGHFLVTFPEASVAFSAVFSDFFRRTPFAAGRCFVWS